MHDLWFFKRRRPRWRKQKAQFPTRKKDLSREEMAQRQADWMKKFAAQPAHS